MPALKLETAKGQKILYSDKSIRQLAFNDTTKYDKQSAVKVAYIDSCNKSTFLLNDKYRFKRYIEFEKD